MIARFALIFLLLSAGCQSEPQAPLASTERLLMEPPEGWERVYQFNNNKTRLTEFVPPGETADEWNIKLSVEAHADLTDNDPLDLIMAEVERLRESCRFIQHFNLFSGLENGYPTSVRLTVCGENRAIRMGEITLIKAIGGKDFIYLLRLNRRVPMFEETSPDVHQEEVGVWSNYLSRITVCDGGNPEHPCP